MRRHIFANTGGRVYMYVNSILHCVIPALLLSEKAQSFSRTLIHCESSWREKEGQLCRNDTDCDWLHKELKVALFTYKKTNTFEKTGTFFASVAT